MSDFRAQDSLTSSTTTFAVTPGPLTVQPPLPTAPDAPVINKLLIFQTAVGIPVSAQNPYSIYKKNRGIYLYVIHKERYSRWSYHIFEFVINVCLMLQILLAAALTALGASSAKHTIITAFGAANTILAGTVALLKGQGLPNRLRQDWNTWRDLRDYIEEKEREIGCGKPGVDVWAEVKIVEDKYDAVKQNQEKNRPDSYTHIDKEEHIELEDGVVMMSSRKGKGKASF
ncbi:MAG: hypothetical protein M1839_001256 [Geoglossum umbratile]|nr:MAG: hypothetical protein M1839_001256 [Geoglossum umbratile]